MLTKHDGHYATKNVNDPIDIQCSSNTLSILGEPTQVSCSSR